MTPQAAAEALFTDERAVELARYEVSTGRRRLIARRRRNHGITVTDHPLYRGGRAYHVDSGFNEVAHIEGFVADYLAQAELLDACPMSDRGIYAMLDRLDADLITDLLGASV